MPVAGITIKPYPKSRAGRREVPLHRFAVDLLTRHRAAFPAGPLGEVFTGRSGNLMSRHTFRARVWRPSLVRAGLLGSVTDLGDGFLGTWTDKTGTERRKRFPTWEEAVSHLAQHAGEGLRFHDLRHCYATWLVSEGVPVNGWQGSSGTTNPGHPHRLPVARQRLSAGAGPTTPPESAAAPQHRRTPDDQP